MLKEKEIIMKEHVGWGIYHGVDGYEYLFNYEVEEDEGLGALQLPNKHYLPLPYYTIKDIVHHDNGDVARVTIEIPSKKKHNKQLQKELEKFMESGNNILKLWTDELEDDYPFDKSFDELLLEIENWTNKHSK